MKTLLAVAALLYSASVMPGKSFSEAWDEMHFGAPCSLKTDIVEGTCNLKIKRKPVWK